MPSSYRPMAVTKPIMFILEGTYYTVRNQYEGSSMIMKAFTRPYHMAYLAFDHVPQKSTCKQQLQLTSWTNHV